MSNYNNLTDFLRKSSADNVTLTFDQLEDIVGVLPKFVSTYPSRLFNENVQNSYSKYWHSAGFLCRKTRGKKEIIFYRGEIGAESLSLTNKHNMHNIEEKKVLAEDIETVHQEVLDTPNYGEENRLIEDIFKKYPYNTDIDIIAMKVAVIDVTNSTQISKFKSDISLVDIAKIIQGITDFDRRLAIGDPELVSEISRESASKGKNLFSFASKYCCYHNNFVYKRDDYSIFDQVVKDNLPSYLAGLVKSDIEKCRVAHDYKTFNDIIGQILDKNNIYIENRRRKFDHYIWYLNRKNFY